MCECVRNVDGCVSRVSVSRVGGVTGGSGAGPFLLLSVSLTQ